MTNHEIEAMELITQSLRNDLKEEGEKTYSKMEQLNMWLLNEIRTIEGIDFMGEREKRRLAALEVLWEAINVYNRS